MAPRCPLQPVGIYGTSLQALSSSLQAELWSPSSDTPAHISVLRYCHHAARLCSHSAPTRNFTLAWGRFDSQISTLSQSSFEELKFEHQALRLYVSS